MNKKKREIIWEIYQGFNNVSVLSALVLATSIVGYYSFNEMGINKYNGLLRALIPVAGIEFLVSVTVINVIDYKSLRVKGEK